MSWQPQTPLEHVLFFVAGWLAVSMFLAFVGGWMDLARTYRLTDSFEGRKWHLCSASFRRFVHYGGVLTIGANERGLYLSVWVLFRLGHPPLLIPWQHVHKVRRNFLNLFSTPLMVGHDSPVRVSISSRLLRRLEDVLGHELQTAV